MGLFLDLKNSNVDLSIAQPVSPNNSPFLINGTNRWEFGPLGFMIKFGIGFDPDPKKGVGGSSAGKQSWTIGVVQNVMSERLYLEYDDGTVFQTNFPTPVLDSLARFYKPFVYDPPPATGRSAPGQHPLVTVTYTSKGYDELFDPFDPPQITNKPNFLDMLDHPTISARVRLSSGAWIKKIERISSFRTWLVANTPTQTLFVGHVPDFSLVARYEITVPPQGIKRMLDSSPPDFAANSYSESGVSARVNVGPNGRGVRPAVGVGAKTPVMTGTTAGQRGEAWLRTSGLLP